MNPTNPINSTNPTNPMNPINPTNPKGFTLFELLVAIVIFALVLSTIYASATGTFRVVGETESRAEIYRMARIAMERMLEDLESVYVQEIPSEGGEGLVLYRSERLIFQVLWSPEEDTGGLVLCEKLGSVDFIYHGKDDEIQDDWDSDSEEHKGALPRMVTLSLEFNGGPDTNVPLRFMTRAALPAEQGSSW